MDYFVCFYQDVNCSLGNFKNGDATAVNQDRMFEWLQMAHEEQIKISIYSAECKVDMS